MRKGRLRLLKYFVHRIAVFSCLLPFRIYAQNEVPSSAHVISLSECVSYALQHQPLLQQTRLNEEISASNTRIALADWWPQLNLTGNLQHYVQQPVVIFPDFTNPGGPKRKNTTGVINNSTLQLSATQNLYNTGLMIAGKTAPDYRLLASQNTKSAKIDLIVNVSKAYYDVLLSEQQIKVLGEDVQRQEKNTTNT